MPVFFRPAAASLFTLALAVPAAGRPAGTAGRLVPLRSSALASVALLPSVGPASDDDRRDLDDALRQGLLDADEIDLLSPLETRQQLMSLAEMGLVCLPEDVACLVKLGLVSDVAWVLVPVVDRPAGREVTIEIGVVDVAAAKRARTIDGRVSLDDSVAMGGLALRAMALGHPPGVVVRQGQGPSASDPSGHENTQDSSVSPGPSPGVIAAGIGGMVAGVSLVGATVCELVVENVITADKDTRKAMQPLGAALWGTALLGLAAVGAGIYLLIEEPVAP